MEGTNGSYKPFPNTTHSLVVSATDQVGNTNTSQLATAEVQIFPVVDPRIPSLSYQGLLDNTTINETVEMPAPYEALPAEIARVLVLNSSATLQSHAESDRKGEVSSFFDPGGAEGPFWVHMQAQRGRAFVAYNLTVNVTDPLAWEVYEEPRVHTTLNATAEVQTLAFTYEGNACQDTEVFWLHADGYGDDLDLYVNDSLAEGEEPSQDPGDYPHVYDGSATQHTHNATDVSPGDRFGVLITAKVEDVDAAVTFDRGCSGGGPEDPPLEDPTKEIRIVE